MAYPSLPQLLGSTAKQIDERVTERASNGTLRARMLASGRKQQFELRHVLDATDRAILDAHYDANRAAEFDLDWSLDGATYTVVYAAPPQYKAIGRRLVEATVQMEEV